MSRFTINDGSNFTILASHIGPSKTDRRLMRQYLRSLEQTPLYYTLRFHEKHLPAFDRFIVVKSPACQSSRGRVAELKDGRIIVRAVAIGLKLAVTKAERPLEGTVLNIRHRPSAQANPIVRTMKAHAARTKWVYSESGIYPFHAGLPVPPELAIVMPKRFWSGQLTTAEIIETCKRYQTEQIVLPYAATNSEWNVFLNSGYKAVAADGRALLYIATHLLNPSSP